tara:strand:- start:41 stop:157 length:117 start_codon:yes stop_codon:yes gene_type:complete
MFYKDGIEWIDKETLKLVNRKLKIQKELLEINKKLDKK